MKYPTTPASAIRSLHANRELVWELVKRDFIGRYKGSLAGMAWSLFIPLIMLAIYTFVFSVAFRARWGAGVESKQSFAIVLFAGMIVYNLFAECLIRAPTLITSTPNYVKKVVFPLDILAWVALFSVALHFLVGFAVLLAFSAVIGDGLRIGALWAPVVLLPLVLLTVGLIWILASLGVYLRDLPQVMGMVTTVLMFLSPLFYPIDAIPEQYRFLIRLSPLALPIEQIRAVVLWGKPLDWADWSAGLGIGAFTFVLGYWWFQRTRKGFADVL